MIPLLGKLIDWWKERNAPRRPFTQEDLDVINDTMRDVYGKAIEDECDRCTEIFNKLKGKGK